MKENNTARTRSRNSRVYNMALLLQNVMFNIHILPTLSDRVRVRSWAEEVALLRQERAPSALPTLTNHDKWESHDTSDQTPIHKRNQTDSLISLIASDRNTWTGRAGPTRTFIKLDAFPLCYDKSIIHHFWVFWVDFESTWLSLGLDLYNIVKW